MAVLQKYIDQGISVNTSYNPQFYDGEKIPMSEMLQHMVMFYKYGGKQLYYFNTFDGALLPNTEEGAIMGAAASPAERTRNPFRFIPLPDLFFISSSLSYAILISMD